MSTFEDAILRELSKNPSQTVPKPKQNVIVVSGLSPDTKESDVTALFHHSRAQMVSAEIVKDADTGKSAGYATVVMDTPDAAHAAVNLLGGEGSRVLVGTGFGILGFSRTAATTDFDLFNLYLGNLPRDVTEIEISRYLQQLWDTIIIQQQDHQHEQVKQEGDDGSKGGKDDGKDDGSRDTPIDPAGCILVNDIPVSRMGHFEMKMPRSSPSNFCFVRFEIENVARQFLRLAEHYREEMKPLPAIKDGVVPVVRAMRARPPVTLDGEQPLSKEEELQWNNTTVCVMSLPEDTTEKDLRAWCGRFGEIQSVRLAVMKHKAFIRFAQNVSALAAMVELEGEQLKGKNVRLVWARSRDQPGENLIISAEERAEIDEWNRALEVDESAESSDINKSRKQRRLMEKAKWAQRLADELDGSGFRGCLKQAPPPPPSFS